MAIVRSKKMTKININMTGNQLNSRKPKRRFIAPRFTKTRLCVASAVLFSFCAASVLLSCVPLRCCFVGLLRAHVCGLPCLAGCIRPVSLLLARHVTGVFVVACPAGFSVLRLLVVCCPFLGLFVFRCCSCPGAAWETRYE